jgi:CRP-like cAMP-binding protein
MVLSDYFLHEIGLPAATVALLDGLFDSRELPKGHLLLKEGSNSRKLFYLEKGLFRMYYNKDGKDITHFFFSETMVYTPIENVFLNEHYPYNVELLENCIIRSANYDEIEKHLDSNVRLQRFAIHLLISNIKRLTNHLSSIQFQSAQDRYRILIENYPDILLRAPLGHIASYLGITQQTLSVIRSAKI